MSDISFNKMLSLYGNWGVIEQGKVATFNAGETESSHGLSLLSNSLDDGSIRCSIEIPTAKHDAGAFVVFRANGQTNYVPVHPELAFAQLR